MSIVKFSANKIFLSALCFMDSSRIGVRSMFYHVLLTTKCDLKCKYCYEKSLKEMETEFENFEVDYSVPSKISYSITALKEFIEKDPNAGIIFYLSLIHI